MRKLASKEGERALGLPLGGAGKENCRRGKDLKTWPSRQKKCFRRGRATKTKLCTSPGLIGEQDSPKKVRAKQMEQVGVPGNEGRTKPSSWGKCARLIVKSWGGRRRAQRNGRGLFDKKRRTTSVHGRKKNIAGDQ